MNAVDERVTSPVPAGEALPSDRDAASCVLFGEIAEASGFYDLFSFLSRAKWRGELVVQIEGVRRSIFFDEGHVVAAQSDATGERIGEVLRRAGLLSTEQVDACVERQGDGSLRFGEAAVELGFVTTEALFRSMDRQLEAVFGSVVASTKGSFYFFLGFDEAMLSHRQRHKVDTLLVKAISRIEEEEYFKTRVPSWDHVPRHTNEREAPREDRLGIFGAVDGRRTVSQIRDLCAGADSLEVLRGLFELVQSGHVSIEPPRIGVARVVSIYNEAIVLLLRELDAMDEGETVRTKLADFAKDAPTELFGAGIPEDDGSFDAEAVEKRTADMADGEERVSSWLYDYASFALFLARPHLQRRDGELPRDDYARISLRVAALLAPLTPHGLPTELPPSGAISLESGMAPRKTVPALAKSPAPFVHDKSGTVRLPAAKLLALPGVDPTRTVRMKPVTDAQLAKSRSTAALPPPPRPAAGAPPSSARRPVVPQVSSSPHGRVHPRAVVPASAVAPSTPAPGGPIQLTLSALIGLVIVVAGIAAAVAVVMTRGM